jgi:hypothetical protein
MWHSISTAPFERDHELAFLSNDIGSLIRMLGSPNDNEVLAAARALVKEMEGIGGLNALAKVWERKVPLQPPKPKPEPFDFTKVDIAIELFVAGKTDTLADVLKALDTVNKNIHTLSQQVADLNAVVRQVHNYTYQCANIIYTIVVPALSDIEARLP